MLADFSRAFASLVRFTSNRNGDIFQVTMGILFNDLLGRVSGFTKRPNK